MFFLKRIAVAIGLVLIVAGPGTIYGQPRESDYIINDAKTAEIIIKDLNRAIATTDAKKMLSYVQDALNQGLPAFFSARLVAPEGEENFFKDKLVGVQQKLNSLLVGTNQIDYYAYGRTIESAHQDLILVKQKVFGKFIKENRDYVADRILIASGIFWFFLFTSGLVATYPWRETHSQR